MTDRVPILSIRPHPDNPRRGDINMIAESLKAHGQYQDVLVQRSTRTIIAGTNTWKAMKKLRWTECDIEWSDADDAEALEILMEDNAASDKGWTDEGVAFAMLATLPTLEGTGYTVDDLNLPSPEIGEEWPPAATPQDRHDSPDDDHDDVPAQFPSERFEVGTVRGRVDADEYDRWRAGLPKAPGGAAEELLQRLGLGVTPAPQPEPSPGTELVPIKDLIPFPGNPRQGDVGFIAEMLKRHGQTRNIVVNRRSMRIIKGNNVRDAAAALGWEMIRVKWADKDDVDEKRILLIDNRCTDVSSYDTDVLGRTLAKLGPTRLEAAGYTLADMDDVIAGRSLREHARTGGTWIRVGKVSARTTHQNLFGLGLTAGRELVEAAYILGLDPAKVMATPREQTRPT